MNLSFYLFLSLFILSGIIGGLLFLHGFRNTQSLEVTHILHTYQKELLRIKKEIALANQQITHLKKQLTKTKK